MKEERISNYVKLCEEWAQRFLKMDQADLHKRVPELKEENGFLTIIHFGRRYGVSLEDGSIRSHLRRRIRSERRVCSVLHFPAMKRN